MARSQSFDGMRMSVKLAWNLFAYVEEIRGDNSRESIVREWVENWTSLGGLPPLLYRRLIYAAEKRKMSLQQIVVDALTAYTMQLPDPPAGARVSTPIDIRDIDAAKAKSLESEDEVPSKASTKRTK